MNSSTLKFQPPSETPFRQPIPEGPLILPRFPSFCYQLGFSIQHNPNTPAQNPISTLLHTRRFSSLDSCHYQYCFDYQYTLAPLSAMWEKPGVLEINISTSLLFPAPPWYNIRLFLMFPRLPDFFHATSLPCVLIIYLLIWHFWR